MKYYIQYTKNGLATQCSKSKYYKAKREVIQACPETYCIIEFIFKTKKLSVIL